MKKVPSWHKLSDYSKSLRYPDKIVFVKNSTFPRHRLKKRLIDEEFIPYKCFDCGLTNEWNGKRLVLQLDHKNGVNNDNRLKNLQFLCPNCHSQTDTYCARNRKRKKPV